MSKAHGKDMGSEPTNLIRVVINIDQELKK